MSERDSLAYALYPQVYTEWRDFQAVYGEVSSLPTDIFLHPLKQGKEAELKMGDGKALLIKLVSIQDAREDGTRIVVFEIDGEQWYMPVTDQSAESVGLQREKATGSNDVGSPMPGVVVGLKVKVGDKVEEGETVATLSAMKMETSIPSTIAGVVKRVLINVGDKVDGNDLLMEIE